ANRGECPPPHRTCCRAGSARASPAQRLRSENAVRAQYRPRAHMVLLHELAEYALTCQRVLAPDFREEAALVAITHGRDDAQGRQLARGGNLNEAHAETPALPQAAEDSGRTRCCAPP